MCSNFYDINFSLTLSDLSLSHTRTHTLVRLLMMDHNAPSFLCHNVLGG